MAQNSHNVATILLRLYAIALLFIGLKLVSGGTRLLSLGGSPYYVLFGIALLISAVLLWLKRSEGASVYGLTLLATLMWALWEVGPRGWLLMPRLLAPTVVGLILVIPPIRNALIRRRLSWSFGQQSIAAIGAVVIGLALHIVTGPPRKPRPDVSSRRRERSFAARTGNCTNAGKR
jgi:glucose dehydrogenase